VPQASTRSRVTVPRVTIREVLDPRDRALRPAYALLRRTFAPGELVDLSDWTGSLDETAHRVHTDLAWHLLVAERGGKVIGIASGMYIGSINVGIIGYLAASADARAAGIGSRLRERLRARFARDAARIAGQPLGAIVGEVSLDNRWLRKLAARPGVILLDFPYFQPRLRDDDEPSPFVLYYESLGAPRRRLPAGELRGLLYAIWRRVYRIARPLDRSAFRAMLRAIARKRSIGSRSLDDVRSRDH
jgi:GNAT superfamily N-acetyltransferase